MTKFAWPELFKKELSGEEFNKWLGAAENKHRDLMKEAGFIAK